MAKSESELSVVSMLPSATEIIDSLGLTDSLVGRSHECDFPSDIKGRPAVTFAHIDATVSSAIIDASVKKRLAQGLSVYGIHEALLESLDPDVIVTQTQCEVCAVSVREVKEYLRKDRGLKAELVILAPNRLDDVWEDILKVAKALGVQDRGRAIVSKIRERMAAIEDRSKGLRPPSVAFVEWLDPLMAAGNWVPEIIRIAGGDNLFGTHGVHSGWIEWEDLTATAPEVVVVAPCGFDLPRTEHEVLHSPQWSEFGARYDGNVYLVDGNSYFNRSGPRLVDSTEIVAEILHPEVFNFGHQGYGWKKLK